MKIVDHSETLNLVYVYTYNKENELMDYIVTANATLPSFSYFLSMLLGKQILGAWPGEETDFSSYNPTNSVNNLVWYLSLSHTGFNSSNCSYNPVFTIPASYLSDNPSRNNIIRITNSSDLKIVSKVRFVEQSSNCGSYTANIGGIQLLFDIDYTEANIDIQDSSFTGYCENGNRRYVAITELDLLVSINDQTPKMIAYTTLPIPVYKYDLKRIEVIWTVWFKPFAQ
jgi:hypothetical protein